LARPLRLAAVRPNSSSAPRRRGAPTAGVVYIYATAPDCAAAAAIAEALVAERLAACVNILAGIRSVYRWKGAIERANEAAIIVKTTKAAARRAAARLRALHPYETPAIAAFSAFPAATDAATAAWIAAEVGPASARRSAARKR
jgi:periplasmic divalent cation tolerance protein